MADALKQSLLGADVPPRLADMLARAWPAFDRKGFLRDVSKGYDALELMQRGVHMAQAMRRHLPQDIPHALQVLVASMDPPMGLDAKGEPESGDRPYSAFLYLPHSVFIAQHGLDHFEEAFAAQHALTQRFSAEWCVRPYLERYPQRCLQMLLRWTQDPSAHVRRLVSEGTRPRLPWASRLQVFARDPSPLLPLLDALKDDPSSYVRRSVANHLGDLAKDHPRVAIETARRWMVDAGEPRRQLVRHALRHPVKQGDTAALAILGHADAPRVQIKAITIAPARARIGARVDIDFQVVSTARRSQDLLIDLRIHYRKADGRTAPKTFKLKALTVPPGAPVDLHKSISLAQMSTRTHHPGVHAVEALINGQAFALGAFDLR